jgi:hypothetical protein
LNREIKEYYFYLTKIDLKNRFEHNKMDCEFCHKQFAAKSTLLRHQKTVKACLKIQEQIAPKKETVFICDGCKKELSSKQNLQLHKKICKNYRETNIIQELEKTIKIQATTIDELKIRIRELELDMKDVAIKSKGKTTITTNIQQNFTPITDERLAKDAEKLTLAHLVGGGEKLATIFLEGSLKNNAVCTDVSRKILHLKDGAGKIMRDVNAGNITKRAFSSMLGKARDIKNKCGEDIDTNDDEQIEEFGKAMSVVGEMSQAISGQNNEVSTDFAKAVCVGSSSKV